MKKKSNSIYPYWLMIPAILIYSLFFIVPVVAAFALSFTNWDITRLFSPIFNGLDNFKYIFTEENFRKAVINTLNFAIFTTFFKVFFGLLLALAVAKKLVTKGYLRTTFYLPAILSTIVVGILFSAILKSEGGMLNRILASVGLGKFAIDWLGNVKTAMPGIMFTEVWKWSGFTMAIFLAGIQSISKDYYESATIDGATSFMQFAKITVPLLMSSFNIAITLNLIGGLKVFEQVYVMTNGGPGNATEVVSTFVFKTFSNGMLGRSTAAGLILFLMVSMISLSLSSFMKKREVEL